MNPHESEKTLRTLMEMLRHGLLMDTAREGEIRSLLKNIGLDDAKVAAFEERLQEARHALLLDRAFFYESDPAADSEEEIEAVYPGFKAIFYHRIAHIFYDLGFPFEARIISEEAHFLTGIDIHPGAKIGTPFFIDHGTGIVIGETTIIGNYVKLYQGVTLGALSLSKGHTLKGRKRHPTIGDRVTIYSGASILGGNVTIGNDVVIGSNVFLTKSIPDCYKVAIGEPTLVLIKKEKKR